MPTTGGNTATSVGYSGFGELASKPTTYDYDVLGQPKGRRTPRGLEGPDPLEDPHPVVQGVGQHMDLRLPPRAHRPIQPEEPRHDPPSSSHCLHA